MRTSDLLGVAALTVLGSLLARRLRLPERLAPFVPILLSVLIVWLWMHAELGSFWEVLGNGAVCGLLAAGMLHIILGLTGR